MKQINLVNAWYSCMQHLADEDIFVAYKIKLNWLSAMYIVLTLQNILMYYNYTR